MPPEQDSIWFLSHPWFVGIIGGIVSGLIVFWITRVFFSQREDRLHKQNISSANQEILVSLRPVVAEGAKIDQRVASAMIHSTARKWSVKPGELYSIKALGQELIKEVMDSSFINHETKETYCTNIADSLMAEAPSRELELEDAKILMKEYDERNKRARRLVSTVLGLTTGITTAFMAWETAFQDAAPRFGDAWRPTTGLLLLLPTVAAMVATLTAVFLIYVSAESERRRSHKRPAAEKKEEEE